MEARGGSMKKITAAAVCARLPKRMPTFHKGNFGRVLVVAGSRGMCGAGFLCALGALRAGAGLVAWALPKSMQPAFAAALPEVITLALAETADGLLALQAQKDLSLFCEHFKPAVLACGPGMGRSALLPFILKKTRLPLVADADALNFLAAHPEIQFSSATRPCIFTPHPGEMARLLRCPVALTDEERLQQVQQWSKQTGAVAVLKGFKTLVARPGEVWENTTGSVALAKGGSGDVLTGVIAGLWAQLGTAGTFDNQSALQAALCGVYLHGLAGELAAREKTVYSVLAGEVCACIPSAIKKVLGTRRTV